MDGIGNGYMEVYIGCISESIQCIRGIFWKFVSYYPLNPITTKPNLIANIHIKY